MSPIKLLKSSVALLAVIGLSAIAMACPFCSAVKQTLRQEMESMDVVAIGELVSTGKEATDESEGRATFKILKVVRGEEHVQVDQTIDVTYFGPAKSDKRFLLLAVDPTQLLWSSPLSISKEAEEYIHTVLKLPEDPVERLKFFQGFFEHEDTLLARDAYDEFALAPYNEVKMLKPHMNREKLLTWIQDDSLDPNRKRLYYTLLAICGEPKDCALLETMLRSKDPNKRAGLDALIASYLTLQGDAGLPLIEELFLKNKESQYAETYSAIMALRFHGTEGGVLKIEKIVESMHHILDRPELADLVIPDLARWKDWSQIDRLVELFKTADDNSSWVRVPVVNYLRACPLPVAAEKLKELEAIDPKAVQRAKTFFPIPASNEPKSSDSTSIGTNEATRSLASGGTPNSDLVRRTRIQSSIASSSKSQNFPVAAVDVRSMNRWNLACVGLLAATTLALSMWLILTGAGRPRVAQARVNQRPSRN
jgi:hypothetical protein